MARDIAIVSGYLVRCPLGGYAWQNLHYLLGLEALGYEAYFYEHTAQLGECFDPRSGTMTDDPSTGIELADGFLATHGFGRRWMFEDTWRGRDHGLERPAREEVLARARVWLSLASVNRLPERWRGRAGTIFVDLDPGYTQIQAANGDATLLAILREHRAHFTVGEHIGTRACALPTGGIEWRPTRPPVALSCWTPIPGDAAAPYTTIGRWDEQRREVAVAGHTYSWRKRTEWMKLLELPQRTGERFLLAMDVHKNPADAEVLRTNGWEIVDPVEFSASPDVYRRFIRESKGEFTVAKDLNVRLQSGWFSDRAACYLAAGRPVINQDTGLERLYPLGHGLHAFHGLEDAAVAFAVIGRYYPG